LPRLGYRVLRPGGAAAARDEAVEREESRAGHNAEDDLEETARATPDPTRQITHCFLRLANLDSAVFDRLSRYEATLWRQIVQTMFALEPLRRHRYRFGLHLVGTPGISLLRPRPAIALVGECWTCLKSIVLQNEPDVAHFFSAQCRAVTSRTS
jgi:hypothetical protein